MFTLPTRCQLFGLALTLGLGLSVSAAPTGIRQTFEVRRYEVIGNTVLNDEELNLALTNAMGPKVRLDQIFKSVAGLRATYHGRGWKSADVRVPQQEITNGIVFINVNEGDALNLSNLIVTNATKPLALEVRQYEIRGNTLL